MGLLNTLNQTPLHINQFLISKQITTNNVLQIFITIKIFSQDFFDIKSLLKITKDVPGKSYEHELTYGLIYISTNLAN